MSTDIGSLTYTGSRDVAMHVARYWGGDKHGVCVQLTAVQEDGSYGYIQLNVADIIALLPVLKEYIIDYALESKSGMAIAQPLLDTAALLYLGASEFVVDEEVES